MRDTAEVDGTAEREGKNGSSLLGRFIVAATRNAPLLVLGSRECAKIRLPTGGGGFGKAKGGDGENDRPVTGVRSSRLLWRLTKRY